MIVVNLHVSRRWLGREGIPLWLRALLFAVAYYVGAWLGRKLSVGGTVNVNFWLPAGVYLAVILLNPRRYWPWLAAAALVANYAFDYHQGTRPVVMIFFFWGANTLQAVVGAWLLQRYIAPELTLSTLKEFAGLIGIGALGSTMLGALVGAATLVHFNLSESFKASWLVWWGSCAMPVLVLTPFILVWCSRTGRERVVNGSPRRTVEAGAVALVLFVAVHNIMLHGGVMAPYKIWLVPVLLYAGIRFGLHGATASTVLSALMIAFYNAQFGSMQRMSAVGSEHEVIVLQSTLAAISLVGIIPAIVLAANNRANAALRDSEERFSKAFHSSPDAIVISDLETGLCIDANESFYQLFRLTRAETIGRTSLELGLWRDVTQRDAVARELVAKGHLREIEATGTNRRGETYTVVVNADLFELAGRLTVVTTLHDITAQRQVEATLREAQAKELRAREEFAQRLIAAQENERHRLAADLHDSLGQNLSVIKSRALMAAQVPELPAAAATHMEAIDRVAATAIDEARRLAHNLHPPQIEQVGLTESLQGLIREVSEACAIRIESRLEDVDDLISDAKATHVFRVVQEALNNLVKHSQAVGAKVTVDRDVSSVRLRVQDDGVGFDPLATDGQCGLGLTSIRERVRMLGGTCHIASQPGQGTQLTVEIPVPETNP